MRQGAFQVFLALSESIPFSSSRLFSSLKHIRDLFTVLRRVEVFLIRGSMENDNRLVTTLFIGGKDTACQFARVAYSNTRKMSSLGRLLSFQIDPLRLPAADVKVICLRGPLVGKFLANGYLILPHVDFDLDLRVSIIDIFKRLSGRRRKDIKKLQRYNYSYAVCRKNHKAFDFFYWKMYIPYITRRFKTAAITRTYLGSKACYRDNGGIIFVKRENKPVAGILFQIRRRTLYALSLGVYGGNQELVKDLTGQAALLFLIKWAKERDLTTLNYGATVPFLKDGTFQYKKEWGMFVEARSDQPFCVLGINSTSEGSLSFLVHNPFIFLDRGLMKAAVFVNHMLKEDELQQVYSKYFLPKLSLVVLAYDGGSARPINESEASVSTQKVLETLPEPIIDVCRQMRKRGRSVQIREYTRTSEYYSCG